MSNGIAAGLSLAGLVWLAVALAQTGPAQPSGDTATTLEPHVASIASQVDAARGRVWSLTGAGVSLYDRVERRQVTLPLPGWHWAGGAYGCLPDLALGPRGEVIVTSDVLPKPNSIRAPALAPFQVRHGSSPAVTLSESHVLRKR